jgi:hypothetical protein
MKKNGRAPIRCTNKHRVGVLFRFLAVLREFVDAEGMNRTLTRVG